MQLTIHRTNFGVTPDKEWFQKIDGQWLPIPCPDWAKSEAKEKNKKDKVVDLDSMRMKPPKGHKPKMVKVYRIIQKEVPDHEAEVLCRNGWIKEQPDLEIQNVNSA